MLHTDGYIIYIIQLHRRKHVTLLLLFFFFYILDVEWIDSRMVFADPWKYDSYLSQYIFVIWFKQNEAARNKNIFQQCSAIVWSY